MVDWLALLLQIGGFGAVLLLALFVGGKWLIKRITAALDSYTTAYLQQKAAIDARIERLEQLAEEQARLTRTVESIKDEIAAQAKSRDNRWAFRKDVYVKLVFTISEIINRIAAVAAIPPPAAPGPQGRQPHIELLKENMDRLLDLQRDFLSYTAIAPLAMADEIARLVGIAVQTLTPLDPYDESGPKQWAIILGKLLKERKLSRVLRRQPA
jgi:hypothetical protein